MIQRILSAVWKPIAALIVAVLIVNGICMVYYHVPYWIDLTCNATQSIWRPGAYVLQVKEGVGYQKVDDNGYMNENLSLSDDGYVLVLGSSHTQGKEVKRGERYTDLLNEWLGGSEELMVYNMGTDGHVYDDLVCGFTAAIAQFPNASTVVLEIRTTECTIEELTGALEQREYDPEQTGTAITESLSFMDHLKAFVKENVPLITAIKKQLLSVEFTWDIPFGLSRSADSAEMQADGSAADDTDTSDSYYDAVLATANLMREAFDGTIIVMYHGTGELQSDGSFAWNEEDTYDDFRQALEDTGIIFLDLQDRFEEMYDTQHVLPNGFNNTSPGTGHMNRYGHLACAEALYEVLTEEN